MLRAIRPDTTALSILDGTFTRNGRVGRLSPQEHTLVSLLVLTSRPRSVEELAETLWPECERVAVRNCAKVCIHRLRAKLDNGDVVVRRPRGYALGPCVDVDVHRIEAVLAEARTAPVLETGHLLRIEDALERLTSATVNAARGVHEIERYLFALVADLALMAFDHAARSGDFARAVRAAERVVAFDPCDELGHELAIRAHLARGDEMRAARAYREHERSLRHDLDTEPSERLRSLLASAHEHNVPRVAKRARSGAGY